MAGNRLLQGQNSNASKVGKNFLFAEPDPQNEEIFRDISLLADHETALMFTMIYPFLWFLVFHARPGSSNCRVLIQRSCAHAIGSEIIGTAFRTGFSDSLPARCTPPCPILTLATSDILASPHPHHLITLRNLPRQARPP